MGSFDAVISEARKVISGELPPLTAHSGLLLLLLTKSRDAKITALEQIEPARSATSAPNFKAVEDKKTLPYLPHVAEKVCTRCTHLLSWDKFYRSRAARHSRTGLSVWCKRCQSIAATAKAQHLREHKNGLAKSAYVNRRTELAVELGIPSKEISPALIALSLEAEANRRTAKAARKIGRELAMEGA